MESINKYLTFMFTYFNLRICKQIFEGTQYNYEYMFYTVWMDRSKKHPDRFWTYLDNNCKSILFNFIENYTDK